jgi:XTP/dITP diphosphohydrolase
LQLFFATTNPGKLAELARLTRGMSLQLQSPSDRPGFVQAREVGGSFGANALIKAAAAAQACGGWALADDSGLCVDALDGAPGLHSARWSGEGDPGNNAKLLRELTAAAPEPERRGAVYRCALALCEPGGDELLVEAELRGRIALAPRGTGGFGYDPLFELPDLGRTFGELSPDVKAERSHRALAFRKLVPLLELLSRRPQ